MNIKNVQVHIIILRPIYVIIINSSGDMSEVKLCDQKMLPLYNKWVPSGIITESYN